MTDPVKKETMPDLLTEPDAPRIVASRIVTVGQQRPRGLMDSLKEVLRVLQVILGVTLLIHVLCPEIPHPWHPYVPWGVIVGVTLYFLGEL